MTREEDKNQTSDTALDIHAVLRQLPHRYPFLLIDRVLRYTVGESLTAIKNVTYNEPFFSGHFPVRPVMPGVLILEAMAQATGILAFRTAAAQPSDSTLYYLVGIDKARFKRPVEPGDRIVIDVRVQRTVRNIWFFDAEARVDDELVASAEMMCAAKDIPT
ncbi:MAG: 3-hydroxyacyl-ACP dehydratase FabZ [Gammaproteobacteria bacterium]|jgi:3-hydroxyacyl-[acyl-carrier-protein] dehydratase|nr:3-hydroxyacyl-ACP dehydratase FabZ [Gammaproteobacteria bacterium]